MSEKIRGLLDRIRAFMESDVYALEQETSPKSFFSILPELEQKRMKVKEMGLWTPQVPEAWGGLGLSLAEFGQISEVLGRSPYGLFIFNCNAPDAGNIEVLISQGTEEQQERFLRPLLAGAIRSCFSMTEPEHAGSNPVEMSTTAVEVGDEYMINGHKWFTTAADGAAFAIVMAVTDPLAESPYARASQIIVPTDTPGFQRVRNISVMGEEGEGWMSHGEIVYENCRVPKSNLLGDQGAGFAVAQERLATGRIHHCMRWIGICERAFEMMCERAVTRRIGSAAPLATKQTIQNWIAESRADIDASRLMVLDTARKIDEAGPEAARTEISVIKFFVARVLDTVLDRSLQTHGALGMTDDILLSFWVRHERGSRIYDGPDEVHKSRVARRVLREYGLRL
ncbi:MAG TPA: acyl-CoA dehydrogenase [Gemmatimonadetes bacterium]|jgi:alkylation response protein AidB-like acyl-CoA dehydrogenase|nr:acyl-CoA dehydrogenase [Gemmatimonadota bacterium]